jgi:hypothetical protein
MEAWLLASDPTVNEAVWINGMRQKQLPYTSRELKVRLYGHLRPTLDDETRRMVERAKILARDL